MSDHMFPRQHHNLSVTNYVNAIERVSYKVKNNNSEIKLISR